MLEYSSYPLLYTKQPLAITIKKSINMRFSAVILLQILSVKNDSLADAKERTSVSWRVSHWSYTLRVYSLSLHIGLSSLRILCTHKSHGILSSFSSLTYYYYLHCLSQKTTVLVNLKSILPSIVTTLLKPLPRPSLLKMNTRMPLKILHPLSRE